MQVKTKVTCCGSAWSVFIPRQGGVGGVTSGIVEGGWEGPSVWTQQEVEGLGKFGHRHGAEGECVQVTCAPGRQVTVAYSGYEHRSLGLLGGQACLRSRSA